MKERAALKLRQMQPDIARLNGLRAKINNLPPLFLPIRERNYFKFELREGDTVFCESMLDAVTWLESGLSEPDTLSLQDIDPFYLGYLFGLNVPSLSIPGLGAGPWQVKEVRIVSGAEIAAEKIRIPSPVGELLFDDIPQSMLPITVFTPPRELKIQVKFMLGSSQIKFKRLTFVHSGDLLLIQKYHAQVHIADKRAFGFNLSEEGIMIENDENQEAYEESGEEYQESNQESNVENSEESSEENSEENAQESGENVEESALIRKEKEQGNMEEDIKEKAPVGFNANKINLRMNFLLQQQDMTLEEISQLHVGSLVTLLPDAEKKIMMTINNQVYAMGELIQIGDSMAVEVTEVYFDKSAGR